jgi:predicted O-methyltransferase YrrM
MPSNMRHEQSGNEEYVFISSLVTLLRPQRILEVGTALGFAALAMAQAMQGGGTCNTGYC